MRICTGCLINPDRNKRPIGCIFRQTKGNDSISFPFNGAYKLYSEYFMVISRRERAREKKRYRISVRIRNILPFILYSALSNSNEMNENTQTFTVN